MLLFYFIISSLIGLAIFFFRIKAVAKSLTILFSAVNLVFVGYCWMNIGKTELDYFTIDKISVLLLSILAILTVTTVYHGFIYLKNEEPKRYNMYHSALIGLIVFMSGAYLANGITVVWVFVEATTLAVALLIYHDRTAASLEATWKYVFVCSIGIALAYIGILFLGLTLSGGESLNLSFNSLSKVISLADPLYLKIAFIFVLVGYSTKMGLFPMHTVTIDAHSVSPAPISAFISTTLMNVGFLAIFRVYILFSTTSILSFMNNALILSGVLSILIASGYMLKAKHNKRMLAYSSLENMGIVAIAVGIGGIGYYAAILHILLHSFTKAGLFYQMGQSYKVMGTYNLDNSGNYMKLFPAGGVVLLLGLICITAIPPSGLFISEFLLFKAMAIKGNYILLIAISFLLCFVLYALTTRIMHILFSEPRKAVINTEVKIGFVQTISQFILFGIVIYLCFIQPQFIKDLINGIIETLPK